MKTHKERNDWALFSYITAYIKPYLGILLVATIALAEILYYYYLDHILQNKSSILVLLQMIFMSLNIMLFYMVSLSLAVCALFS